MLYEYLAGVIYDIFSKFFKTKSETKNYFYITAGRDVVIGEKIKEEINALIRPTSE